MPTSIALKQLKLFHPSIYLKRAINLVIGVPFLFQCELLHTTWISTSPFKEPSTYNVLIWGSGSSISWIWSGLNIWVCWLGEFKGVSQEAMFQTPVDVEKEDQIKWIHFRKNRSGKVVLELNFQTWVHIFLADVLTIDVLHSGRSWQKERLFKYIDTEYGE